MLNLLGGLEFLLLTVVTVGLTIAGSWLAFHSMRQIIQWPKVSAQILRYWVTRSEGKPDGQRFYHPVLRFDTTDGRTITTISNWGSWRKPWRAGRSVPVRYSPKNPQWAEIACFANLWGFPLTIGGVAMIWFLVLWWRVTSS